MTAFTKSLAEKSFTIEGGIHQSSLSDKLVFNDGFSNFELPLLVRNSTYVVPILCGHINEVISTFITKFETI